MLRAKQRLLTPDSVPQSGARLGTRRNDRSPDTEGTPHTPGAPSSTTRPLTPYRQIRRVAQRRPGKRGAPRAGGHLSMCRRSVRFSLPGKSTPGTVVRGVYVRKRGVG